MLSAIKRKQECWYNSRDEYQMHYAGRRNHSQKARYIMVPFLGHSGKCKTENRLGWGGSWVSGSGKLWTLGLRSGSWVQGPCRAPRPDQQKQNRKQISGCQELVMEASIGSKGAWGNFLGWENCSLLWWWLHNCMNLSNPTEPWRMNFAAYKSYTRFLKPWEEKRKKKKRMSRNKSGEEKKGHSRQRETIVSKWDESRCI